MEEANYCGDCKHWRDPQSDGSIHAVIGACSVNRYPYPMYCDEQCPIGKFEPKEVPHADQP